MQNFDDVMAQYKAVAETYENKEHLVQSTLEFMQKITDIIFEDMLIEFKPKYTTGIYDISKL
jgi:hypothetical protein